MAHITPSSVLDKSEKFPCPTLEKLGKMNRDSIQGLAYALQHNVKVDSNNDFGQATLDLTLMLLNQISEIMNPEQTFGAFLAK